MRTKFKAACRLWRPSAVARTDRLSELRLGRPVGGGGGDDAVQGHRVHLRQPDAGRRLVGQGRHGEGRRARLGSHDDPGRLRLPEDEPRGGERDRPGRRRRSSTATPTWPRSARSSPRRRMRTSRSSRWTPAPRPTDAFVAQHHHQPAGHRRPDGRARSTSRSAASRARPSWSSATTRTPASACARPSRVKAFEAAGAHDRRRRDPAGDLTRRRAAPRRSTLVADYLTANPGGLDAVWVGWDDAALGAAQAVNEAGSTARSPASTPSARRSPPSRRAAACSPRSSSPGRRSSTRSSTRRARPTRRTARCRRRTSSPSTRRS